MRNAGKAAIICSLLVALCFLQVRQDRTTFRTADLPLGIQNCCLSSVSMCSWPAWVSFWWASSISNRATWCFGGIIIAYWAPWIIGASEMRQPTLITPSINTGRSLTIPLVPFTFPRFFKSLIYSEYISPCNSFTIAFVAFFKSSVVRYLAMLLLPLRCSR